MEVILRNYKANADPSEGVTKDAYRIWRERNPNKRSNLTNNELMNQRRYIERRNKLKEIEIDDIKRRIKTKVNGQTEGLVADMLVEKTNSPYEERNQDESEHSQNHSEIEDLLKKLRR